MSCSDALDQQFYGNVFACSLTLRRSENMIDQVQREGEMETKGNKGERRC